jgi:hypothetical protein
MSMKNIRFILQLEIITQGSVPIAGRETTRFILKTYCNMEHCFNHEDTAIQTIVIIICMAFNIFRSFVFRRLKSFKEGFEKKKVTISWFIQEMFIELTNLLLLLKLEMLQINFLSDFYFYLN